MRWSSLTPRDGLVLIEANFKTGCLRKKRDISRRPNWLHPPPIHRPPTWHHGNEPRDSRSDYCFSFGWKFATSKFIFFLRHFNNSCGSLLYTLDLRLQRVLVWWPHLSRVPHLGLHQKQVERPPHIDVRYERAGPLQRSKKLVGLGDDSIMCVSSLRSRPLEVP